ncbi:MAG: endolytic transglycosylase MltG [Bacilli bacterium]|nr:endolytic transglycosylase MltG [Bacilli bacterium]
MKNFRNMAIILLVVFTTVILALGIYYKVNMTGTSNSDTKKIVNIEEGTINDIAKTLKDNNLIKNVSIFKVYIKLTNKSNLKAGIYELSENMGVEKIVKILEEGTKYNPNEISITFKEGINIRKIATLISENTNNSYDDVIKKASDETFIDTLINKYWFLTEDIKNKNIYYSLEGYLFPDTYRFNNREVTTEEIFTKMLDEMDKKLSKYKDEINKSDLSVHEIITLASVVELEGAKATDRKGVAGVFYNRLASSAYPTLGSDATTYYASKIDDWSYSLTYKELNDCKNKYNTRCSSNTGLPVGPICNPGIESIEATINPDKHEYYYFVADCNGKVYLTKNSTEHNNIINKLKKEDNWCA